MILRAAMSGLELTFSKYLGISCLTADRFFGKISRGRFRVLDEQTRLKLLDTHVAPNLVYRASGWPPQLTLKRQMDALQARFVSCMVPVMQYPLEPDVEFFRRRAQTAHAKMRQYGLWKDLWYMRAHTFHDHISRNNAGNLWSAALLRTRSAQWLTERWSSFVSFARSSTRPWAAYPTDVSGQTNSALGGSNSRNQRSNS